MVKLSNKAIIYSALLVLLFIAAASCGYYSFSGSGLKGTGSVAVPLFENQTQEYGIRESLKIINQYFFNTHEGIGSTQKGDAMLYFSEFHKSWRKIYAYNRVVEERKKRSGGDKIDIFGDIGEEFEVSDEL